MSDQKRGGDPKPLKTLRVTPGAGPSVMTLVVIGPQSCVTYPVPANGTLTIGREPGLDVVIDDRTISRQHALLHSTPEGLAVEDLGSANGVRVGDRTLSAGVRVPVPVGEPIELGAATLLVQRVAAAHSGGARSDAVGGAAVGQVSMSVLHELVGRVAKGNINILLLGETGVGKEVFADLIHRLSPRASHPLLKLNCSAFSESLLEAELFGYEAGAFTDAKRTQPGLLETAAGGTVFLDEVGELPLSFQAKLLRVLEERQVRRVGGRKLHPLDVRFISATNRDLEKEIEAGTFRQDLFFRLNGIGISIPPLRERADEIGDLAQIFLTEASRANGNPQPPTLAPATLDALLKFSWPGNIRELRNVIERAVLLCEGPQLLPEHLWHRELSAGGGGHRASPPRADSPAAATTVSAGPTSGPSRPLMEDLEEVERRRITEAMEHCKGNRSEAARMLGIARNTLIERLKRFDLQSHGRGEKSGTGSA